MSTLQALSPLMSSAAMTGAGQPASADTDGAAFGRELQRAREAQPEPAPAPREAAPAAPRTAPAAASREPERAPADDQAAASDKQAAAESAGQPAHDDGSKPPAGPARKDARGTRAEARPSKAAVERAGMAPDKDAIEASADTKEAPGEEAPSTPVTAAGTPAADPLAADAYPVAAEPRMARAPAGGERAVRGSDDAAVAPAGHQRSTASRGVHAGADVEAGAAQAAPLADPDSTTAGIASAFEGVMAAVQTADAGATAARLEHVGPALPSLGGMTRVEGAGSPQAVESTQTVDPRSATLEPPVGSEGFAPALGARVAVLARDGIDQARLNVHPAELGPIALRLALDGTQVRVDMTAEVASTRQALERALPELATALQDAGFTLTGGGVFHQAPGDRRGSSHDAQARADGPRENAGDRVVRAAARLSQPRGLVDLFA